MHVGGARYTCNPVSQCLREFKVVGGGAPYNLQVYQSGKAEIQNLLRNIGRLEKENHVWESFVEPLAEKDFVFMDRPMSLAIQRDRNFTIRCGDVWNIALSQTSPGIRYSD